MSVTGVPSVVVVLLTESVVTVTAGVTVRALDDDEEPALSGSPL